MMNKITRVQQEIIAKHQVEAPVHIVPMAKELGLKVFKNKEFPDNLSGLIMKEKDNTYSIHANGNQGITRQRFTIAHELAHFLLHKDEIGDGIKDDFLYRSKLPGKIEREANKLGAALLKPEHLLKTEANKSLMVSEQAEKFWVSNITMDIRLGEIL